MTVLAIDRGWRYDERLLKPQWDRFNQRVGFMHPHKPSVRALGYPTVFMGWTFLAAAECCRMQNKALEAAETQR